MRLLGWFSKLLMSVLLISFLSIFTTAYMVDLYINRFLEQWNLSDTLKPTIDVEDYVSKLANPSQIWDHDAVDAVEDEKILNKDQTATDIDPGLPVFNQGQVTDILQDDVQESSQDNSKDSSMGDTQDTTQDREQTNSAQTSIQPPVSSNGDLKDTLVMSAQEFNERRKKLTNQDKSAIFSIVITKLPQTELQKMSLLLEDGITEEELADFVDVINAYLEKEEVDKLIAILNKY